MTDWSWFAVYIVATFVAWLLIIFQAKSETGFRDPPFTEPEDHED
jgi:hypothetical protein